MAGQKTPVNIDPEQLKDAEKLWVLFTKVSNYVVAAIVVILILMAIFLL